MNNNNNRKIQQNQLQPNNTSSLSSLSLLQSSFQIPSYSTQSYKLKYFETIVWIDSNRNILYQIQQFVSVFQDKIWIFHDCFTAMDYIGRIQTGKVLIICSSRLVQEIHSVYSLVDNVYKKYIVFCGSKSRANEIMNKYPSVVQGAFYDTNPVIKAIKNIQKRQILQNTKPNIQPKINPPQIPIINSNNPIFPEISPITSMSQPTNTIKQTKKILKKPKIHPQVKIIWVLQKQVTQQNQDQLSQIRRFYAISLQQAGYFIQKIDGQQKLKKYIQLNQETKIHYEYIILAKSNFSLYDFKAQIPSNNQRLIIRITNPNLNQKNFINQQEDQESQIQVTSCQKIIEVLNSCRLQELVIKNL